MTADRRRGIPVTSTHPGPPRTNERLARALRREPSCTGGREEVVSEDERVRALLAYVEQSRDVQVLTGRGVPLGLRIALTRWTSALARRRAQNFARRSPLRLHLGSGRRRREGWVNIDLVGRHADIAWTVTQPLPFAANSVDAIFHEALVRYLSMRQCLALTRDCFRVLRPGGVLRVGVVDTLAYSRSYATDPTGLLESLRPHRPTPLLALQEMWYMGDARTVYDYDTLALIAQASGFAMIESRAFGSSRLEPCPDAKSHEAEMFYLEAVKD